MSQDTLFLKNELIHGTPPQWPVRHLFKHNTYTLVLDEYECVVSINSNCSLKSSCFIVSQLWTTENFQTFLTLKMFCYVKATVGPWWDFLSIGFNPVCLNGKKTWNFFFYIWFEIKLNIFFSLKDKIRLHVFNHSLVMACYKIKISIQSNNINQCFSNCYVVVCNKNDQIWLDTEQIKMIGCKLQNIHCWSFRQKSKINKRTHK